MFPIQAGGSCMWTNDSQRLLLEHFDMIHDSPSQLYHSALPFSPSSSWLHKSYSPEFLQVAKVVKGLSAEWGMCSRTVLLNYILWSLSCWKNTIAVGSNSRDILILDAITGSQTAVLPGHIADVRSVTFSSDGISLVSGSSDKTVKLWDVQTGGVVRTFHGHTDGVLSVSISADHTTIASGSEDHTLRLWDIQRGECHQIIEHQEIVYHANFSPTNHRCLISVSGRTIQQWDTNGHKVGPTYNGRRIALSPDGTWFISHTRDDVTIHNINSGLAVANFHLPNNHVVFCFSPDYKFVATSAPGYNICVLDITGLDPHLVETFIGHTNTISSLTFSSPSTLISASYDRSVKFWQIGTSSTGPIVPNPESTPLTLAPTKSTALGAKNGFIIPSDLPDGVVQTWGIFTGLHKRSFQITAEDSHTSNIQLIDNKLIFVWYTDEKINIWDAEKGEPLQTINAPGGSVEDLKVSGDGTKIFCMCEESIQAWDIWTGETVGRITAQEFALYSPGNGIGGQRVIFRGIEGSKIWVIIWGRKDSYNGGCDFGIPGSPPVLLSRDKGPPHMLHLNDNRVWESKMARMKDTVTGKVVVQLPKRFGEAIHAQWDGHYLVVSFKAKEAVILDFSHVSL